MKSLETTILEFDTWEGPISFYESICASPISEIDLELFKSIWEKADNFELWKDLDLILGCKAIQSFIRDNYNLPDTAIAKIVRAVSYKWY